METKDAQSNNLPSQSHLSNQDLNLLNIEELTPLTADVISRQVRENWSYILNHRDCRLPLILVLLVMLRTVKVR